MSLQHAKLPNPIQRTSRADRFLIGDPRQQERLRNFIREDDDIGSIENVYEFAGFPHEKIFCVQCNGHRHGRGYTVLLTSGDRVTVGSKCGRDLFGEAWTDSLKRFKAERSHWITLQRAEKLRSIAPDIERHLPEIARIEEQLNYFRDHFSKSFPELYGRLLESAIHHSGRLLVYETKTVYARQNMDHNDNKSVDKEDNITHKENIVSTFHVMSGQEFLPKLGQNRHSSQNLKRALRAMVEFNIATTEATSTKISRLVNAVMAEIDNVRANIIAHRAVDAFFKSNNISRVATWATSVEHIRGSFEVRNRCLIKKDSGRVKVASFALPKDILVASSDLKDALRKI